MDYGADIDRVPDVGGHDRDSERALNAAAWMRRGGWSGG